ncbi:MAG: HAD-IIIC family phosphatase, partial [Ginsengibacter sp.]
DPKQKLKDYLANTNDALAMAYNNQDYPFDLMVEECIKQRDISRNPFFDTMLNFHLQNSMQGNSKTTAELWAGTGIDIKPVQLLQEDLFQSVLDFKLDVEPAGKTFDLYLSYNSKLFTEASMSAFLNDFVELLNKAANGIDQTIEEYGEWKQSADSVKDDAPLSLNICASFVIEPVEEFIEYWSKELELNIAVSFAPYNQVFQQLLNAESALNKNGGINALFIRLDDWLREKRALTPLQQIEFLDETHEELIKAVTHFGKKRFAPLLVAIVPLLNDSAVNETVADHISKLNDNLEIALKNFPGFHLLDIKNVAALYNVEEIFDAESDHLGHMPFTEEYYAALGTFLARKVNAFKGPNYKVVALDCDNTLWKGICGELGPTNVTIDSNFSRLQEFFIKKYDEGFLLVLCSKNNEADVWEVFDQHPGMKLKREHIAAHRLNWKPKPDNLLSISRELNLGANSFIFVDDNEFEVEQMALRQPEVLSLMLPEDEADLEGYLNHIWAFDYFRITEEDKQRNYMYKVQKQREQEQVKYDSAADFIKSLNLEVNILPLNETNMERAVQLTMRTNQFNINGIRKTPEEMAHAMAQNSINWVIQVKDRFGDYGIVGLVLAKEEQPALVVETFLLSCRVLGRNVEDFILTELQEYAAGNGLNCIKALFTETPKNKPFKEFLGRTQWVEDIKSGVYERSLKDTEIVIS